MTAVATTRVCEVASPGCESSSSTVTVAGTSGWTFDTTMAYCCCAAFSDADTTALSRSAAQYSQPTLESCCVARRQSCTHAPCRHAYPLVTSHVLPACHDVPVASQVATVCPWHSMSPGAHVAQASRDGAHTCPVVAQSVVVCHEPPPGSHAWSVVPLHCTSPSEHAGASDWATSR